MGNARRRLAPPPVAGHMNKRAERIKRDGESAAAGGNSEGGGWEGGHHLLRRQVSLSGQLTRVVGLCSRLLVWHPFFVVFFSLLMLTAVGRGSRQQQEALRG